MDAVEARARDRHALEQDAIGAVDLDPVLAPDHGELPDGDVVGPDDDPTADDRPRLTVEDLAARDHDRSLVDACAQMDGRRPRRPGRPEDKEERGRRHRDERHTAPAELAAVLRVGEAHERPACMTECLREDPREREEPERRLERRGDVEEADERHRRRQLEQSERDRRPRGLVRQQPVVEARRRARARLRSSPPPARPATRRRAPGRSRRPRRRAAAPRPAGTPVVLSACTTCLDPAKEAAGSVLHPGERVCRRVGPLGVDACDCESSRVIGELADRRVRREDQPATVRLEPVLLDEPAQQRIVRIAPPESGRTDDLILAVDGLRERGTVPPRPPGRADRPRRVRADTTVPRAPRARRLARPAVRVESGQPALREERAGEVERPTQRLATSHGDDLAPASSAFSHSVAAAIPAPTTATRGAYPCGSYAWTARGSPSSSAGIASPGCPSARRTCRNRSVRLPAGPLPISSSKPPSTAVTRSTRSANDALVPAASPAKLVDVAQELVDGRSVAVAGGLHERHQLAAAYRLSRRESRERGRVAMAVALGAHARLADRLGARAPGADGVRVWVEDDDLGRLEAAVAEGLVGDEAGQAAADDRELRPLSRARPTSPT